MVVHCWKRVLRRSGWAGAWVLLASGACVAQDLREAKAVLHDGRALEGVLVLQNDRVVVLNIAGIETTLQRADVAELEVQQTPQELYDAVRPTLADTDLTGRLELAQRMLDRDAFALARRELADLARLFPGDPRIARLDTQIAAKQALASQRVERPAPRPAGNGSANEPSPRDAAAGDPSLLSAAQIDLIRVYEVDLDSQPRGITVSPETVARFFEVYRDADNRPLDRRGQIAFRRMSGAEQLDMIFATRDRTLYEGVSVVSDPPALGEFRNRINGSYVTSYFIKHFGKDAAGDGPKLPLMLNRPSGVPEAYTNFFVLNGYVGAGSVPMIDRRNPAESLLVQWGLPRDRATHPAPDVPGWQPYFRGTDDPRFDQIVRWIGTLYPTPPANYGLSFDPGIPAPPADPTTPPPSAAPATP